MRFRDFEVCSSAYRLFTTRRTVMEDEKTLLSQVDSECGLVGWMWHVLMRAMDKSVLVVTWPESDGRCTSWSSYDAEWDTVTYV